MSKVLLKVENLKKYFPVRTGMLARVTGHVKAADIDVDILFAYLITDVAKEIFLDNSRQYGNGLIKFEPNDLNKGMAVDLTLLNVAECSFIKDVYAFIKDTQREDVGIQLLSDFFSERYSKGDENLYEFQKKLQQLKDTYPTITKEQVKRICQPRVNQLNFLDLFEQYANNNIVENAFVCEGYTVYRKSKEFDVDLTKNILISLVKEDNMEQFINRTAKIYYTGKKFPATVALNKLYYFMPYMKGKGIKDLYLIKIARVGSRKEGQPDNDTNDLRLVFEIEYLGELFKEYKPITLDIWHTFKDTTIKDVVKLE